MLFRKVFHVVMSQMPFSNERVRRGWWGVLVKDGKDPGSDNHGETTYTTLSYVITAIRMGTSKP
jgi:hypothetical protein